jgi:hypothetical protein
VRSVARVLFLWAFYGLSLGFYGLSYGLGARLVPDRQRCQDWPSGESVTKF